MLENTKRFFFQKLIEDTFGYYRIYDTLKLRSKSVINGDIEIHSSEEFWNKIHNNHTDIKNRQVIKFKDFFLTDWVPKLPGQVWTDDGKENLLEGIKHVEGVYSTFDKVINVLGPVGKQKMISGGYGSVRIKPTNNSDYYSILNLVHVDDWHCDYGIPIVVSKAVHDQFIRYREHQGAPWIEELRGILILDEEVSNLQKISPAIGSKLDIDTIDILSTTPNSRKVFIYISSPLDIQMRYNSSHPEAIAWTLFKTKNEDEPLRLTYSRFNPEKNESILEAVGFINEYVANFDGDSILTDFDGIQKRLISKSSLTQPQLLNRNHTGTLKLINDWIKQENI